MNDAKKGKRRYVFEIQSNAYDGYWIEDIRRYTRITDDICVEEEWWLPYEKKSFATREQAWDFALSLIKQDKGEVNDNE